MNRIFIEARHKDTAEYNFLKAILSKYFHDKECEFVFMNGFGNLFNEVVLNQMNIAEDNGDHVMVLLDADTPHKGGGFEAKKEWMEKHLADESITIPYFLYPNNKGDGDVECLMEEIARRDFHKVWFDCFEDYEACVSGVKDETGKSKYNTPNLKGKLHTYISSMPLESKERNKLGSGDWLFDNVDYWDLSSDKLRPILDFFRSNIK